MGNGDAFSTVCACAALTWKSSICRNGYNTWESVWGGWNGISDRDSETIRRIFTIFRALQPAISSCDYAPFTAVSGPGKNLKCTKFPKPSEGIVLWTVVNDGVDAGPLQSFNVSTGTDLPSGARFFDVWQGREIHPQSGTLSTANQKDEYGAVAAVSADIASSPEFEEFLAEMAALSKHPIATYSDAPHLSSNFSFGTHNNSLSAAHTPAAASVHVPQTLDFLFQTQSLLGEPYLFPRYFGRPATVNAGTVKQTAGEVLNEAVVAIGSFQLDTYPVTNSEYLEFLKSSGYQPADDINFLKHLPGNGSARSIPAGMEKQPVTWVGFEDASRFCQHYGRRLPNEWEWAYAAGNGTSQRWPWGNESREDCMPEPYTGRDTAPLPDVDAFDGKQCASPFGAQMLVGTVWQWTNSLQDAHTRTAMLKGGSSYWRRQANASTTAVGATARELGGCDNVDQYYCDKPRCPYWFGNCAGDTWVNWPKGGVPTTVMPIACQGELILIDGGYERASTIGFRCAVSDGPTPPQPPQPPPAPAPPGPPAPGSELRVFSPTVAYSWSGGTPDATGTAVRTGVFSYSRGFQLQVEPSSDSSQAQLLRLYVGSYCRTATLKAVSGQHTASKTLKRFDPTAPCSHETGTVNAVFQVTFTGELTLTWKSSPADDEEAEEGNLTWQSVTLQAANSTSSCAAGALCVSEPTALPAGSKVDLSAEGSLGWSHWGGVHAQEAQGGPAAPDWHEEKMRAKTASAMHASLVPIRQ